MLVDTRKETFENKNGFTPNVQNQQLKPKLNIGYTIINTLLGIFTVTIWWWFLLTRRNWFNAKQQDINKRTSDISIQLVQRRDTLIKLLDLTKSHMKYEKETLNDLTQLRTLSSNDIKPKNLSKINKALDKGFAKLNVAFEAYPNLRASDSVMQLMSVADLNEREIAASRRLYNQSVMEFNQRLFVFPTQNTAARMKLYSLPLFEASQDQKQDIKLDLTSFLDKK
ncbi:MAG: LemA family protein [Mycoplasma sp.]|nr:LemA family protein [Mycoplasma sp.]